MGSGIFIKETKHIILQKDVIASIKSFLNLKNEQI
jgi:hypothetical protein